jgi:hypothetical protein
MTVAMIGIGHKKLRTAFFLPKQTGYSQAPLLQREDGEKRGRAREERWRTQGERGRERWRGGQRVREGERGGERGGLPGLSTRGPFVLVWLFF